MCTRPKYAMYKESDKPGEPGFMKFIKVHPEDNYYKLKEKYGSWLITIPCAKCEECRRDYATNWAVRCALEAAQYKDNWFLTLTYDQAHYKDLNKDDIREFFDKLSGKKKKDFKYWLAGEYGPTTGRAHYHCILMNYDIKGKPIGKTPQGHVIYESKIISKAWGKGFIQIEEAGDNAMAYCAKYATKTAKDVGFRPMMSKGIGLKPLEEQQDFINKYGYIQGKGGKKYKIPRYYFKKIKTFMAAILKEEQKEKGKRKTAERARFNHLELDLIQKERDMEITKGRRAKL